jgi:DNA-binding transcriptional MerR regulator
MKKEAVMQHNDEATTILLAGDAAGMLGISLSRLNDLIRRGRLSASGRTPGGIRLFRRADVLRLRAQRERERSEREREQVAV